MHRASIANAAGAFGDRLGPAFKEWLKTGGPGRQGAYLYLAAGWVTDDALAWAHADIAPETARMWLLLGVTVAAAARLEEDGMNVSGVVRDWWSAAVPLEHVAGWLGAGFTAREAHDLLGAGIDLQRAEDLRAPRDGTDV